MSVFLPDGWWFLPCDHGLGFEISLYENSVNQTINQSINQSEAELISLLYNMLISAITKVGRGVEGPGSFTPRRVIPFTSARIRIYVWSSHIAENV